MNTATITRQDETIALSRMTPGILSGYVNSDSTDYRAMLARVGQGSVGYNLRTMVEEEVRTGMTHREFLENVCGETITGTKSICHVFEDDLRGMER